MTEKEFSMAIEGQQIFALPEAQRYCDVVEPAPEYTTENESQGGNPNAVNKLKLIANVKLHDGKVMQYYVNRTSARAIARILNTDLTAHGMKFWVGHRLYWGRIADMMVGNAMKKVLFVTDAKKLTAGQVAIKV